MILKAHINNNNSDEASILNQGWAFYAISYFDRFQKQVLGGRGMGIMDIMKISEDENEMNVINKYTA